MTGEHDHGIGDGPHFPTALAELVKMWNEGAIDPIIDSTFPFERTGEAHAQLEEARNFGKVVLVPG